MRIKKPEGHDKECTLGCVLFLPRKAPGLSSSFQVFCLSQQKQAADIWSRVTATTLSPKLLVAALINTFVLSRNQQKWATQHCGARVLEHAPFPKRAASQKCFAFDGTQAFQRAVYAQDANRECLRPNIGSHYLSQLLKSASQRTSGNPTLSSYLKESFSGCMFFKCGVISYFFGRGLIFLEHLE